MPAANGTRGGVPGACHAAGAWLRYKGAWSRLQLTGRAEGARLKERALRGRDVNAPGPGVGALWPGGA